MVTPPVVVVVGSGGRAPLRDALLDAGLTPLEREGIQPVLGTLRHEPTAGIVVDATRGDVDVLELLLNVRDVSTDVALAVIGSRKLLEEVVPLLGGFDDVLLFSERTSPRTVVADLVESIELRAQG